MNKIHDEFLSLVTTRPNHRARGFINIDCPACGDNRKRGGFAVTASGGFRYSCFNGGCPYNDRPTGWEPDNGFSGRIRTLFESLGGDIKNIPMEDRFKQNRVQVDANGNIISRAPRLEVATKFPDVRLPRDTQLLEDAAESHQEAADGLAYLNSRTPMLFDSGYPFMWSPSHKNFVLIPYLHFREQIVGYMGRNIDPAATTRFIQRAPPDYMFNQHTLMGQSGKYVFVMESPMDAIMFRGIGTRENRLTRKQINLLKMSGREPILIPDINGADAEPYLQAAKENDWLVSVPDWPKEWKVKDPGDAVHHAGLLYTIKMITDAMSKNYASARIRLGIMTKHG